MCQKQLLESDNSRKDVSQWTASLLKVSLFQTWNIKYLKYHSIQTWNIGRIRQFVKYRSQWEWDRATCQREVWWNNYAANTEKKITSLLRKMTNKACQVNFDEINNDNYYRSGWQTLQNKTMAEEIKFLREQINEKKLLLAVYFRWNYPTVKRIICFIKLGKTLMAKIYLTVVLMMKSPSVNV